MWLYAIKFIVCFCEIFVTTYSYHIGNRIPSIHTKYGYVDLYQRLIVHTLEDLGYTQVSIRDVISRHISNPYAITDSHFGKNETAYITPFPYQINLQKNADKVDQHQSTSPVERSVISERLLKQDNFLRL